MMGRLALVATVCFTAFLSIIGSAEARFEFKEAEVSFVNEDGSPATQAGTHPFAVATKLEMSSKSIPEGGDCHVKSCELPEGETRNLTVKLPAGFVGNPYAIPRCSNADFINRVESLPSCPNNTVIGLNALKFEFHPIPANAGRYLHVPVYNLSPPPGVAAKLGFVVLNVPVTVDLNVNPDPPYNLEAHANNIAQAAYFYASALTVWGNPSATAHDPFRGNCLDVFAGTPLNEPVSVGKCHVESQKQAFLTLPRRCGQLLTTFEALAWNTGETTSKTSLTQDTSSSPVQPIEMAGCEKLGFSPRIAAAPTTSSAESPSGLDFDLDVEDEGLISPSGSAESDIMKAVVTLPTGVTVNPSVAAGLGACSEDELRRESLDSQGCPEASRIGNVEVESPLLEGALLKGSVYVATPEQNPFDALIALYMVIKDPERGILVKIPGKVEPNLQTGQLVTTFGEAPYELPQVPISHFRFHFRSGGRSPLVSPPTCGVYTTEAKFTPWSGGAPVTTYAHFGITSGPDGAPCPAGAPPFHPGFEAGSVNNNAGSYSPFSLRITRRDGEQDMTRFSSILPPGVTGKIAGVAKCSDAAIGAAKAKTGRQELASPSCPPNSEIGNLVAGAGTGASLIFATGKLYLAGPFGGDPLSVVAVVPAVAGPFDAGTVVTRLALALDPDTAEVQVDGAHSDPIPHILKGIPLKLRDLRTYADRPGFTLDPTNCNRFRTRATIFGDFLDVLNPADDVPVSLSSPYQAANCSALKFKPKLSLKLKGGTKRGAHPALRATVAYPKTSGYANTAAAVVTLPHSAFLDQSHIGTICTRVQFAIHLCPAGSIYGRARVITPLLEEPLEGPIYLRSSSHMLPDLVLALHGLFDFNLVGRIDSTNARIRSAFNSAPDVPVTKVILEMQSGKKGLIVNSRDLCGHKSRATAVFTGQNGKTHETSPEVKADCKGGKKPKHGKR